MYFSHLIFAVVLYCVAVEGAVPSRDYVRLENAQGWLKLHLTPASWRKAHLTCYNEGAILASPENEALLFALSDTLWESYKTPPYVFTGIHDTFSKGLFYSLEGTPVDHLPVPWAPGKPSLDIDERCLIMFHNGMLEDGRCTDEHPFFCFKRDKPVTTTADSSLTNCGPADNGYTLHSSTGSCYKFHADDVYWRNAFATCAHEGAHLAVVNSETEANVLKKLFDNNASKLSKNEHIYSDVAHIGLVNWGTHDAPLWMTIHGQTPSIAGYEVWNEGEPNNRIDQRCAGMFTNGKFDDVNCLDGDPSKGTRAFICEKKPTKPAQY